MSKVLEIAFTQEQRQAIVLAWLGDGRRTEALSKVLAEWHANIALDVQSWTWLVRRAESRSLAMGWPGFQAIQNRGIEVKHSRPEPPSFSTLFQSLSEIPDDEVLAWLAAGRMLADLGYDDWLVGLENALAAVLVRSLARLEVQQRGRFVWARRTWFHRMQPSSRRLVIEEGILRDGAGHGPHATALSLRTEADSRETGAALDWARQPDEADEVRALNVPEVANDAASAMLRLGRPRAFWTRVSHLMTPEAAQELAENTDLREWLQGEGSRSFWEAHCNSSLALPKRVEIGLSYCPAAHIPENLLKRIQQGTTAAERGIAAGALASIPADHPRRIVVLRKAITSLVSKEHSTNEDVRAATELWFQADKTVHTPAVRSKLLKAARRRGKKLTLAQKARLGIEGLVGKKSR